MCVNTINQTSFTVKVLASAASDKNYTNVYSVARLIHLKVRLYTARTRTRPTRTRTRTRLLSGFAIQIEHEPERGIPSTDFEAARL